MTRREWKRLRQEAWDSMKGCKCKPNVKHGGKIVRLRKADMCTKKIMRCGGRIDAWQRAIAKARSPLQRVTQSESKDSQNST